jgi:hypothetical protein
VTRYALEGREWKQVEKYEDAIVRDQGEGGFLRVPQAMLRAYSNDPNFFGDEDYQQGNGIHVQTKAEAKRFAAYYEADEVQQYVMDCDGDIALKRIMATVLSKHSYGGGSEEWIVIVEKGDDNEWDGFGYLNDNPPLRYERWYVKLRKES